MYLSQLFTIYILVDIDNQGILLHSAYAHFGMLKSVADHVNFSAPNTLNFRRSISQARFAVDSQILKYYGLTKKQSYYQFMGF